MASIREQILAGSFEVENQGNVTRFIMADCIQGITEDILDDETALVDWLRERGLLLEMIHCGFQKFVIDMRSPARPKQKDGTAKPYTDALIEAIQTKLTDMRPLSLPKPAEPKISAKQLLQQKWEPIEKGMRDANMPEAQIAIMKANFFR